MEDAKFTVCFEEDDLKAELSREQEIFIVIKHNCYCYMNEKPPNTYFRVKRKPGKDFISYGDAVDVLIENEYEPCAHCFLEDFRHVKDTIQYVALFGS